MELTTPFRAMNWFKIQAPKDMVRLTWKESLIVWLRANLINAFSESSTISISQYELAFMVVETLPPKEDIPDAYSRMRFQAVFTAKGEKTKNDPTGHCENTCYFGDSVTWLTPWTNCKII